MKNQDNERLLDRKRQFDERRRQRAIMRDRARRARAAQAMARIAGSGRAS